MLTRLLMAFATASVLWTAPAARAQLAVMPRELEEVRVDEALGKQLPRDARFQDHTGKQVRLGQYLDGKRPVLLNLAYHSCPVLCGMVLHATVNALRETKWSVGEEFDVVTLSIDPRDTPDAAARKRVSTLNAYGRPSAAAGWHFLVGTEAEIRKVADTVGFRYRYDEDQKQYAHPAVVMFLTPAGKLARYLYGLEYDPTDVRLALLEASQGRSISTAEQVLLYCYMYDPKGAKYAIMATRVMQVGGGLTVIVLGTFLTLMWRLDRRRRRESKTRQTIAGAGETGTLVARSES